MNGRATKPKLATATSEASLSDDSSSKSCQIVYRGQRHLRVRLPYLTVKRCDTERLQQSVAALLGVTDVRLNAMARSLSVAYDPGLVVSGELEAAVLHGCEVGMIDLSVGQPPVAPLCLTQTRQTVGYDVLHQTP